MDGSCHSWLQAGTIDLGVSENGVCGMPRKVALFFCAMKIHHDQAWSTIKFGGIPHIQTPIYLTDNCQVCLCGVEAPSSSRCSWPSSHHSGSLPQFSWLGSPSRKWCLGPSSTFLATCSNEDGSAHLCPWCSHQNSWDLWMGITPYNTQNMVWWVLIHQNFGRWTCPLAWHFLCSHPLWWEIKGFLGIQLAFNAGWNWLAGIAVCWAGVWLALHCQMSHHAWAHNLFAISIESRPSRLRPPTWCRTV